jgi:hypothetical protein
MNPLEVKIPAPITLVMITDAAVRASISRRNFPHESISEQKAVSVQRDRKREAEARRSRIDREQIFGWWPETSERTNRFQQLQSRETRQDVATGCRLRLKGISKLHGSATLEHGGPIFDAMVTLKQVG